MTATASARILTSSKKLVYGLEVTDVGLQDKIVDWVSEIAHGVPNEPLRNLHLLLFDAHSKALPLKFLERHPTSMVLVEAVQQSASMQREFVAKHLSSGGNASPTLLAAFHSSFKDLLVPSKSKPYNERFLQTIFLPDQEYFNQAGVEKSQIKTVAVGCLPSAALQQSLLNSLYAQWLVFVHNEVGRQRTGHYSKAGGGRKVGEAAKSIYEIADFTLVTFLHSTTLAQLVCGKYEPVMLVVDGERLPGVDWRDETASLAPRPTESSSSDDNDTPPPSATRQTKKSAGGPLSFFAKSHRHFSFLFNLFFEVRLLNGWDGFPVHQTFAPIPADPKKTGHAEKLEKLGIKHSDFYAVSIHPRSLYDLTSVTGSYGIELFSDAEAIMRFAFWLTDFTPKLRGTKPINDELRRLLPGVEPLFLPDRLVNEVSPVDFLRFYSDFTEYFMEHTITPDNQQQYNVFCDRFLKASERNYVD